MSSRPVTFTATEESQAVLSTLEKGRASRFINEAIKFYKVYGVNHNRSSIIDLNDLFGYLNKLRNPSHLETELTASLSRFLHNHQKPSVTPAQVMNFAPPEPTLWEKSGFASEEEMNADMARHVAELNGSSEGW